MSEVTLYAKDGKGMMREWSIEACEDGILIRHGHHGGNLVEHFEVVPHGKSTRTRDEQIMLMVASKIAKRRDAGYCYKLEDAQNNARTNALNLARPMLAQTYDHPSHIKEGAVWQYKYNGLRCLMIKTAQGIVAYSRNGKPFTTLGHITSGLAAVMEVGDTFDGELYIHGKTLQSILSFVKRKQPETALIKYHIYDKVDDKPYAERYRALWDALQGSENVPFTLVPTTPLNATIGRDTAILKGEIAASLKEARVKGYEGIMIRHSQAGYETGKRSRSLLKVKVWLDEEYKVVAIHASKDGWAILECQLPQGGTFTVSAPGTVNTKKLILKDKEKWIGKWVSVQFAELTKDGIPFHPVATMFRNKEEE